MTDLDRLLAAGDALADAAKAFRVAYVLQDTTAAQLRSLAELYAADSAYRAIAREVKESSDANT